jgi:hypothetical protein
MHHTCANPATGDGGAAKVRPGKNKPFANSKWPAARQTQPVTKSSVGQVSRAIRGEQSDSYPVIANLNPRWRVIACKHSIQWVLQKSRGADNWRAVCFCRTSEGLMLCARERAGEIRGDALVVLLRLPERFPEAAS